MICDKCNDEKKALFKCNEQNNADCIKASLDTAMASIWYGLVFDKGDLDGYKRKFTTEECEIVSATFNTIERVLKRKLFKEK